MRSATSALAAALTLLLAGCGGEGGEPGSAVPCSDSAFRAQDEELYVTGATVSNALGGGGDPAVLLLDLRRARAALAGHLDSHPPCDELLVNIAGTEREAIAALDEAIAVLSGGGRAEAQLTRSLDALAVAENGLGGVP